MVDALAVLGDIALDRTTVRGLLLGGLPASRSELPRRLPVGPPKAALRGARRSLLLYVVVTVTDERHRETLAHEFAPHVHPVHETRGDRPVVVVKAVDLARSPALVRKLRQRLGRHRAAGSKSSRSAGAALRAFGCVYAVEADGSVTNFERVAIDNTRGALNDLGLGDRAAQAHDDSQSG